MWLPCEVTVVTAISTSMSCESCLCRCVSTLLHFQLVYNFSASKEREFFHMLFVTTSDNWSFSGVKDIHCFVPFRVF